VPFEPLAGGRPRLGEQEIDDIVAFLKTLTDADAEPGGNVITGHAAR
jgi:hypothetical protein